MRARDFRVLVCAIDTAGRAMIGPNDENDVADDTEIDTEHVAEVIEEPKRASLTVRREGALVVAGTRVLYNSPEGAYLASLNTPKSRQTAVESMRRIARAMGADKGDHQAWLRVPWSELTYGETNTIRARVVAVHGAETARLTISVLRGVLRSAFRLGLMPANRYLRAVSLDRIGGDSGAAGRMLSPEETTRLYAYCDTMTRGRREMMRALLSCGLGAGLRREELTILRVDGVKDDGTLEFVGKGRKLAKQKVAEWAAADIGAWLAVRAKAKPPLRCATLFVQLRGAEVDDLALTVRQVWDYLVGLCKPASVRPFTPHDLRRTYISRLIATDLGVAKTLARHKNVSTTLRYDRRGEVAADEVLKGFTRT
jgi:integrase